MNDETKLATTIDVTLVGRLLAAQFPQWASLPIRRVDVDGWDNRTFRLGDDKTVRLPSARAYVAQVEKEQRWLPRLAPHLPLPIPEPLAIGAPGHGYPWPWSVYRWLVGQTAAVERISDLDAFAHALARFLVALQRIDSAGAPPPGPHNFWRGGRLTVYDAETRRAIAALKGRVDGDRACAVWREALSTEWSGKSVWLHGDVSAGNLLVADGRLCAVIDFGCAAAGDPACDLTIAWTFFRDESRKTFRGALALDAATWARARGWALWKALITLERNVEGNVSAADAATGVIESVFADAEHSS